MEQSSSSSSLTVLNPLLISSVYPGEIPATEVARVEGLLGSAVLMVPVGLGLTRQVALVLQLVNKRWLLLPEEPSVLILLLPPFCSFLGHVELTGPDGFSSQERNRSTSGASPLTKSTGNPEREMLESFCVLADSKVTLETSSCVRETAPKFE